MLKYSEWQRNSRFNQPSNALSAWDAKPGGPHEIEDRLGQENSRLLERYYAEVVVKEKTKLEPRVRVLLDEQFSRFQHKSRQGQPTHADMTRAVDEFSEKWTAWIRDGFEFSVAIEGGHTKVNIISGLSEVGHVSLKPSGHDIRDMPWIGGSVGALRAVPAGSDLQEPGEMTIYPDSLADFRVGTPGTAWIGLCLIARRVRNDRAPNVIYLVPNNPMRTHMTFQHTQKIAYRLPVVSHGGSPGHTAAVSKLSEAERIEFQHLNLHPSDALRKESPYKSLQDYGVTFGFSMVKGDRLTGHYWNFTSISSNDYANAEWEEYADGNVVRTIPGVGSGSGQMTPSSPTPTSAAGGPAGGGPGPPPPPPGPSAKPASTTLKIGGKERTFKATGTNLTNAMNEKQKTEGDRVSGRWWTRKGDHTVPREWASAIWEATESLA